MLLLYSARSARRHADNNEGLARVRVFLRHTRTQLAYLVTTTASGSMTHANHCCAVENVGLAIGGKREARRRAGLAFGLRTSSPVASTGVMKRSVGRMKRRHVEPN